MQKNNPFRNMTTLLYWERQLWSGNECVEIRYVTGSFVAGTSASSPGVPRHMWTAYTSFRHNCAVNNLIKNLPQSLPTPKCILIWPLIINAALAACMVQRQYLRKKSSKGKKWKISGMGRKGNMIKNPSDRGFMSTEPCLILTKCQDKWFQVSR